MAVWPVALTAVNLLLSSGKYNSHIYMKYHSHLTSIFSMLLMGHREFVGAGFCTAGWPSCYLLSLARHAFQGRMENEHHHHQKKQPHVVVVMVACNLHNVS